MSDDVPTWPFTIPEPPAGMRQLAIEMQQLTVSLAEAGFSPSQVLDHVNYQITVGIFGLRQKPAA